jgi:hypothetical protein
MAPTLQSGTLQTGQVRFENGMIVQEFTFRAPVPINGPTAMRGITRGLFSQFRATIEANKITEFAWPPQRVDITPHGDFYGFAATIGTLAREPALTVIHRVN